MSPKFARAPVRYPERKHGTLSMHRAAFPSSGPTFPASAAGLRGRLLRCLAVPACLFALTARSPAQPARSFVLTAELPGGPGTQVPGQIVPVAGTITGSVTDRDGASVGGARITLSREGQPAVESRVALSTSDGGFSFPDVPPGAFKLTIAATGFVPQQTSGELQAGESRALSTIVLLAGSTTDIQVTASQTEIAEAQINQEEKQRVLAIFPNFYVSYIPDPVPLDPKQKIELAARTLIDPVSFLLNGVVAGVQQANNTYSWGQGVQGYSKRYAAAYGTFLTGTVIGNTILPIILKQDPRYFYKGTGSIHSRVFYALANSVVCKGDNHRWQPDYSAILGGLAAGGISNFYYPAVNRSGAALTFEGVGIGTGFSAVTNLLQEFLIHKLTPHLPPPQPLAAKPSDLPAKPSDLPERISR